VDSEDEQPPRPPLAVRFSTTAQAPDRVSGLSRSVVDFAHSE
jgi:hypothetical protein